MGEAVDKFFGIKNGDFSEIIKSRRRAIAESIQVIAVGDKVSPSIIVYDDGEGQEPNKFHDTFLSLQQNNTGSSNSGINSNPTINGGNIGYSNDSYMTDRYAKWNTNIKSSNIRYITKQSRLISNKR